MRVRRLHRTSWHSALPAGLMPHIRRGNARTTRTSLQNVTTILCEVFDSSRQPRGTGCKRLLHPPTISGMKLGSACTRRALQRPHTHGSQAGRQRSCACMSSDRHGVGKRHGGHTASAAGLGTPSVPLPTNRLDTGRPFVFLVGGGASSPLRPVIMCLVEKAVRLPLLHPSDA